MMGNPRVDTTSLVEKTIQAGGYDSKIRFRILLINAGFSRAELAERVGVHVNTVDRWFNGATETPGAVIAYLLLYTRVKDLLETM
jgi:DNA-binding transcriptional regulator YiaG